MIHVIPRGKVKTEKQFLLSLGIHNITGQKLPMKILHELGHNIEYNKVCEIETVQAELTIIGQAYWGGGGGGGGGGFTTLKYNFAHNTFWVP